MRRSFRVGLVTLCVAVTTASACLWDSDTLRQEAAGSPGVLEVLVGRFDRFPPAYYERRIEIAEERLAADPDDLASYDNIGVACDRLGRHDEAIAWMAKKRDALDRIVEETGSADDEHEYRYLANLGTFYVHRWLANGAERESLSDLEAAERLIADAIALNPDAHFGREKYQLLTIQWLLEAPSAENAENLEFVPSIFDIVDSSTDIAMGRGISSHPTLDGEYSDAVEGLTGLIRLGAAWESVDIHYAVFLSLYPRGDSSIAQVAVRCIKELRREGKESVSKGWLEPAEESGLGLDYLWSRSIRVMTDEGQPRAEDEIDLWFDTAREEAERWRTARNRFVSKKLDAGMHPDTHPTFWNDWEEPHSMPAPPNGIAGFQGAKLTAIALFIALSGPVVILYVWKRYQKTRARATPAAHPS